jgi:hypothetical protein
VAAFAYIGRGDERDTRGRNPSLCSAPFPLLDDAAPWSDRIGLLNEVYTPVQYEDLDYCYRAREMGGEVWALPMRGSVSLRAHDNQQKR